MAIIPATTHELGSQGSRVFVTTWANIGLDDTCETVRHTSVREICFQVTGTFGGATVTFTGSNDNSVFETLKDPAYIAISLTVAGLRQVLEIPLYVKPLVSAADSSTDLTVTIVERGGFF